MESVRRLLPAGMRKRLREMATGVPAAPAAPAVTAFEPGGELQTMHQSRETVGAIFLRGTGIEIGALHQPMHVPPDVTVRYVDRMTTADLRLQYPDLAALPLVEIDIIDNGETLATIAEATQDFVIANHFLEHCQNPFLTIQNLFRVLKVGGVLFMAVPDKRWTFDAARPCTTVEHLMRDYTEGPAWSKRDHFEEWSRLVNKRTDEALVDEEIRHLINIDYSIHFHVWGAVELLEFIAALRQFISFEMELFLRNGLESVFVLRKSA
jgi:predicted SAM-dependent methyltransferase